MKEVRVDFKNCHGIRELASTLDFKGKSAIAIYAPNGTMKTSFAKTFADLQNERDSVDAVFPDRPSTRVVTDETGRQLSSNEVVVVLSYVENIAPTESTSTLLVNAALRKEYESLQIELVEARDDLLEAVKSTAGSKAEVAPLISKSITKKDENLYVALTRVEGELREQSSAPFSAVPYDLMFNDQVRAITSTADFGTVLADYVSKLNELLDASKFFDRESFSYYNASNVTKSLGDNKYFQACHSLTLRATDGGDVVITDAQQLADLVSSEQQKITEDDVLREKLDGVKRPLERNVATRAFYEYIAKHVELLPELKNIDLFEEKVWKSYLKENEALYARVVEQWRITKERKSEIEMQAALERTQWEALIDTFNDRFFVPFRLTARNKNNVVLGSDPVLQLGFEFLDGSNRKSVERDELLEVLSNGEKKALYILNVLFEVEARKNSPTLFVIDDLADSFDYKNKYAIIQYLQDMATTDEFRLIILTHNFDFFRTLNGRGIAAYHNCLTARRISEKLELVPAAGIKNPFIHDFKPHFFDNPMKRVASIPFVRNIVEYTNGEDDSSYSMLTSILHWKPDSAAITNADLDEIFNAVFGSSGKYPSSAEPIVDLVLAQAKIAADAPEGINFENKIVLAIAIRILAEQHLVTALNGSAFVDRIPKNQTQSLREEYLHRGPGNREQRKVLDAVLLMTPENLHVNSFMYEPIIDMADEHLRKLHSEVSRFSELGTNGPA